MRHIIVTIVALMTSSQALASDYTNPMMVVGDVHNICVERFGEERGGWANAANWGPVDSSEYFDFAIVCAQQEGIEFDEQAMRAFLDGGGACQAMDALEVYRVEHPAFDQALQGVLDLLQVHGADMDAGVPREAVLADFADALTAFDSQVVPTLQPLERDAFHAAAATAIRSLELWSAEEIQPAGNGGDDTPTTSYSAGEVAAADVVGGAGGVIAGATIGGFFSAGWAAPAGAVAGALIVGGAASAGEYLDNAKVEEPAQTEGDGSAGGGGGGGSGDDDEEEDEIIPDDGTCPDDGWPNP